jgi:hypothetical protein
MSSFLSSIGEPLIPIFLSASGIHYSSKDGYNLRMKVNNLRERVVVAGGG